MSSWSAWPPPESVFFVCYIYGWFYYGTLSRYIQAWLDDEHFGYFLDNLQSFNCLVYFLPQHLLFTQDSQYIPPSFPLAEAEDEQGILGILLMSFLISSIISALLNNDSFYDFRINNEANIT